jgi:hypothetical protein
VTSFLTVYTVSGRGEKGLEYTQQTAARMVPKKLPVAPHTDTSMAGSISFSCGSSEGWEKEPEPEPEPEPEVLMLNRGSVSGSAPSFEFFLTRNQGYYHQKHEGVARELCVGTGCSLSNAAMEGRSTERQDF